VVQILLKASAPTSNLFAPFVRWWRWLARQLNG
jgi:hypothetical protein